MTKLESFCRFDCRLKGQYLNVLLETGKDICNICPLKQYLKEEKQKITKEK